MLYYNVCVRRYSRQALLPCAERGIETEVDLSLVEQVEKHVGPEADLVVRLGLAQSCGISNIAAGIPRSRDALHTISQIS